MTIHTFSDRSKIKYIIVPVILQSSLSSVLQKIDTMHPGDWIIGTTQPIQISFFYIGSPHSINYYHQ
jgi:hypothetical protein